MRDEAILKPIILQACSLIVVVSVLESKVLDPLRYLLARDLTELLAAQ